MATHNALVERARTGIGAMHGEVLEPRPLVSTCAGQ